jgi:hypothetical protein
LTSGDSESGIDSQPLLPSSVGEVHQEICFYLVSSSSLMIANIIVIKNLYSY